MADKNKDFTDIDPTETQEWLDAIASIINEEGTDRARYIIKRVLEHARQKGLIYLMV